MNKGKLPAGITAEMIAEAKTKHGEDKVKFIEVYNEENSDVELTVLACVPTRSVIGQYRRYADNDPKKADDILMKACLLSHKDAVMASDALFFGALTGIAELIPMRKSAVKNC
jgi:hypothetical protein